MIKKKKELRIPFPVELFNWNHRFHETGIAFISCPALKRKRRKHPNSETLKNVDINDDDDDVRRCSTDRPKARSMIVQRVTAFFPLNLSLWRRSASEAEAGCQNVAAFETRDRSEDE